MKNNSLPEALEEQLIKCFEDLGSASATKVSFLLSKVDLSSIIIEESRFTFTPEAMLKLYLFKRIKGFSTFSQLEEHFKERENEALKLGFFRDADNKIMLPAKRTFNEFFQKKLTSEQVNILDQIAEFVLAEATRRNVLLDIDIVEKTVKKEGDSYRKTFKEAVKLVKQMVYPKIDILNIKDNGKFTSTDLLNVLTHVAYSHDFVHNGSEVFSFNTEKPVPSGDLMMYHFNKIESRFEVQEMFDKILDFILAFAKSQYNIFQTRKVDIAYDVHKIPYYGHHSVYSRGGQSEVGTTNFFEYLTCSIVVAGRRFVIDVVPIHPLDNVTQLLDYSLSKVKQKVAISKVLLDRGFDNSKVMNVLKNHNLKYIMPKVRTETVKAYFDKSEDCPARVIHDFKVGKGEEQASGNLVLVDDSDGIKRAFITNLNIPEQLAHHLYSMYSKRWGIETSYRQMDKDFLARTTSNNYTIRLFYFMFSACLYNLWVLVNICLSLSMYGRIHEKPIITSKLFAVVLYQVSLIDDG